MKCLNALAPRLLERFQDAEYGAIWDGAFRQVEREGLDWRKPRGLARLEELVRQALELRPARQEGTP